MPQWPIHQNMHQNMNTMNAVRGGYAATTYNCPMRNQLRLDAERLKQRQMADRQRLNEDKNLLQKDLDSHLHVAAPQSQTQTQTETQIQTQTQSQRESQIMHKELFESLKGPGSAPHSASVAVN